MLAGIAQTPDESVLETVFSKQVKNYKAIQHNMNEYHRADEGTSEKTYKFLVSAVRRHLDRERLEANRDRVAKGLSGASRTSAPAVEGKTGFIPKGHCVAWNKGGCSKDNCTYKHETPKPKDKGPKPSKTGVAQLTVRVLPRGKAKEFVSFGNKAGVTAGPSAISFMRVQLVSQDKPLLPDQQVVIPRIRKKTVRIQKGRGHEALVAQRARRALDRRNPKDQHLALRSRHPPPFALSHPCLHPCPRPCASLSKESFVRRSALMMFRM